MRADRIYKHFLHECEKRYGPQLWADFFDEVRRDKVVFDQAAWGDERRRATVNCFDRLEGLDFRENLRKWRISDKTSLYTFGYVVKQEDWDRRLILAEDRRPGDYSE